MNRVTTLFVVCVCSMTQRVSAANVYVDQNAVGPLRNETSRAQAYLTIQAAVAISPPNSRIRVAEGQAVLDSPAALAELFGFDDLAAFSEWVASLSDEQRTAVFSYLMPVGGGGDQ